MSERPAAPAALPPETITGLNPGWSRHVPAPDAEGVVRTWHLLDSWADRSGNKTDIATENAERHPGVTLLCVHGNPSWSFLWRKLLAGAPEHVRVIAVDQLDMGYSERTGAKRTLATRIEDLCQLTQVLAISGPVITVAHDWGGPISLGWAQRQQRAAQDDQPYLRAIVLTNTAVHQPVSSNAPAVIRLINTAMTRQLLTVKTSAFIKGAVNMSRPALHDDVSDGFHAPYRNAARRYAIADFVADIPLDESHESAAMLDAIAAGLNSFTDIPALLLWGPRDKVFSDIYLQDFEQRLPHAQVHRYPTAAHFVAEDADVASAVIDWVGSLDDDASGDGLPEAAPTYSRALADFSIADGETSAIVEPAPQRCRITFKELTLRVDALAAGLLAFGIRPAQRVAVMIMPGIDLSVVVYACWRAGITLVLVDSGLGRQGMQRALQSARPDYLIGIDKALLAARVLRWPGTPIAVSKRSQLTQRGLQIATDLDALMALGQGRPMPAQPGPDVEAVIAFTSGSTGPSKGVLYTHRQLQAQRDALMSLYNITPGDRLVAAFAPFALYGPTMGITSMVPAMDVTRPGSLSAQNLMDSVIQINASLVFASPAALVNVVATQQAKQPTEVRLVLSAGAPVRATLLESVEQIFPDAELHTPYGMTEVLPVANISLSELRTVNDEQRLQSGTDTNNRCDAGVCVGFAVPGVQVWIDPLNAVGKPSGQCTQQPHILGEIIVEAAHSREGYVRLWHTQHMASVSARANERVHRSADVGQFDEKGRLWVGGRLGHIIQSAHGPIAPVAGEQRIETLADVNQAALVGVGPSGTQHVVAVLQMNHTQFASGAAPLELVDQVRAVIGNTIDVASVLIARHLPVDKRHNSKIDRTLIGAWAARLLAGDKVRPL